MKSLLYFLFSNIGFGTAGLMIYFLYPDALDILSFFIFYFALFIGFLSIFLLLRLTKLQALLAACLFIALLGLQHMRLFNFWVGLFLVIGVIVIEQYAGNES